MKNDKVFPLILNQLNIFLSKIVSFFIELANECIENSLGLISLKVPVCNYCNLLYEWILQLFNFLFNFLLDFDWWIAIELAFIPQTIKHTYFVYIIRLPSSLYWHYKIYNFSQNLKVVPEGRDISWDFLID